jgi:putative sugar O-methyltransferase
MVELRRRAGKQLNTLLKHYGFELVPSSVVYDWQRWSSPLAAVAAAAPTTMADSPELRPDAPELLDLRARYRTCDSAVTSATLWTDDLVSPEDMRNFRADNAYVWQRRGPNMHDTAYALTYYYVRSIDQLGLLSTLSEDELFGAYTLTADGRLISRDLLDSIVEIYFLQRYLNLTDTDEFTVLDIGAGYGRLAHRLTTALPNLGEYLCTDAIPVSTFLCDHYLRFRGLGERTRVVPLDEIEDVAAGQSIDLAVNIHSFSECTLAAINWWISLLARTGVQYLMVVPNTGHDGGQRLLTNDGKDFGQVITKHGYQPVACDPKFSDSLVQSYGINPTYHHLFELRRRQS